ncbi:hypothetical protein [Methylibium rhizosphaerae]|jgi:hypothetical protein|uniref:hypothetical protein n=1 Tax=Methylibium rhizosphaerae TaxID=2570323 RepID=UPI001127E5BA|nr:hypothetical protein [Methylibium rhizosphaerae]
MGISNVNVSAKIDGQMRQNIDAFEKTGKPQGPAPAPAGGAPDGIPTARASASAEMAPRAALGPAGGPGGDKTPDLAAITRETGTEGTSKAKTDAENSMKSMAEMTAIQMQFTTQSAIINLHKSMNEQVAKAITGIGKGVEKVSQ